MNLGQLRTIVRYYLDDNSAARWSDTEVNNYINQAYTNYYNKLIEKGYEGLLQTPVLLNTVSGTATIALPNDFFKAKILYRIMPNKKVPCSYKAPFDNTVLTTYASSAFRPAYSFEGMNLLLDPVPSDTETGAFELHYWPLVTALSADADAPVGGFSAQWHDLLPVAAAYQAKSLREEEDVVNIQAMLAMKEQPFNDMLEAMTIARIQTQPFSTD